MNYKIFKTDLKPWLKKFFFEKFSYIIKTITGTIITITDGIRKKINELKMTKLSTQDGTPSPSNPIDVNTVKGYRNLLDKTDITLNYRVGSNGYDYHDDGYYLSSFIKVKPNTTYTKNSPNADAYHRFGFYTTNDVSGYISVSSDNTITTPATCKYIRFCGLQTELDTAQLTESATELPYVPYGNNYIYTTINGKNLFDISGTLSLSSGYYTYSNGVISIISATTSSFGYWTNAIDVSNGDYTFMLNLIQGEARPLIQFLDSSDNVLSNITLSEWTYNSFYQGYWKDISTIGNNTFNISIPSSVAKIKIGLVPKATSTSFKEILFSKGIETTYEAYKEKTAIIPLNNNEIAGIGDYLNELIIDKNGHCWLNKKIGKIVLDGQEYWSISGTNTSGYNRFTSGVIYNLIDKPSATSQVVDILSNYFIKKSADNTYQRIDGISVGTNGNLYIYNDDFKEYTVEQFQTWLSTHNTIVYYVLATPTLIDLNYNVDLTLYEGINNISNSDDMDMEIKYYSK